MAAPPRAVVVVPVRMASSRLPGKPLADLAGQPMVVRVLRRAEEAGIGPAAVACCDDEVEEAVRAAGGTAVRTRPDHASGSDRVFEALAALDPEGACGIVVNLQGDLPEIGPDALRLAAASLGDGADIATLAAPLAEGELGDPDVVKAWTDPDRAPPGDRSARVRDFSREPRGGEGRPWHHVGVYAYRREALARFVVLPPSGRERAERLEQLRALEDGMRIDAGFVDSVPPGIDTPDDLARARRRLGAPARAPV